MPDPASPVRALPLGEPSLRPLSPDGLARLHAASLRILEETGVAVGSATVRDRLAAAGARVDGDRVRLPAALVEARPRPRRRAPTRWRPATRPGTCPLDGAHGYLSVDGSAAEILDLETGERRASTEADLAAGHAPRRRAPRDRLPVAGRGGRRPTGPGAAAPRAAHPAGEQRQARPAHDGDDARSPPAAPSRWRAPSPAAPTPSAPGPILSSFQVSLSPLTFDGDALEAALVYAEAGVPAGFVVMAIGCATAPATPAGVLAQSNAEVLAGHDDRRDARTRRAHLLRRLLDDDGPAHRPHRPAAARRTCSTRRRSPSSPATTGCRSSVGTFAPGAKSPDWQAGLENGLSGLVSLLAGADMLSGAGLLYAARVFALEEMVLDAEIFGLVRHLAGGITVDDATLAVDVIGEVGPGGNFLAEDHTDRPHARPLAAAPVRPRHLGGLGGRRPARRRATAPASARASLLATHVPPPLPDGMGKELDAIVAAFSREAGVG